MTLGRFVLIFFLVSAAFITTNLTMSFFHQQNIHQLKADDKACTHCNLNNANLAGWDLTGYDLTQSSFVGADLRCSNLQKSRLAGANLKAANLTGAELEGADLSLTNMDQVIWEDGTDCNTIIPSFE